jgi:hypothetical protein
MLNRSGIPTKLVRTGEDTVSFLTPELHNILRKYYIELGRVPRETIPALLSITDALVQPGKENKFNRYRFPSKIPEYLASGKPVILPKTNIGLFLENEKECLFLLDGTISEISIKLKRLFLDKELSEKIGRAGQMFAKKKLRWSLGAKKVHDFYSKVLENVQERIFIMEETEMLSDNPDADLREFLLDELDKVNAQLVEKDALLAEKDAELNAIRNSRTWRMLLLLGKIRLFLMPENSWREKISRSIIQKINMFPKKR